MWKQSNLKKTKVCKLYVQGILTGNKQSGLRFIDCSKFIQNENIGLNKTEKKIVSLLIENPDYNSDELAAEIGVTKRTIERAFISLQNKKAIERIVTKQDGRWIVIK